MVKSNDGMPEAGLLNKRLISAPTWGLIKFINIREMTISKLYCDTNVGLMFNKSTYGKSSRQTDNQTERQIDRKKDRKEGRKKYRKEGRKTNEERQRKKERQKGRKEERQKGRKKDK